MAVTQPPSSIVPTLVAGAVIGFFVIFTLVCAVMLMAGAAVWSTLSFAAFVALFGGPGFGTMFGANWYVHRSGEPR